MSLTMTKTTHVKISEIPEKQAFQILYDYLFFYKLFFRKNSENRFIDLSFKLYKNNDQMYFSISSAPPPEIIETKSKAIKPTKWYDMEPEFIKRLESKFLECEFPEVFVKRSDINEIIEKRLLTQYKNIIKYELALQEGWQANISRAERNSLKKLSYSGREYRLKEATHALLKAIIIHEL